MLLKLRRILMYWFGFMIGSSADSHQVVRNNLIEEAGLEEAFVAFDTGNYSSAFQKFQNVATQGNAVAQYNLGLCYETGSGVSLNDHAAEEWYRKAAEQGLGQAQYDLAAILAGDIIAYQDNRPSEDQESRLVDAYMWLVLAKAQGHSLAANSISRLEPHMPPTQIRLAQELANERFEESD
jgi:uncharacterized protein